MTNFVPVCRTSSQKPGDELYENFRQHFPSISNTPTTSTSSNPENASLDAVVDITSQQRYDFSSKSQ